MLNSISPISLHKGETSGSCGRRIYETQIEPEKKDELSFRASEPQIDPQKKDELSFRGYDNEDTFNGKKSSSSAGKTILGLAGATALIIGGLAYAHKTNVLDKLKDGKIKDFLKKAEPATEKCHEWCSKIKQTGTEWYEKVKNMFTKK